MRNYMLVSFLLILSGITNVFAQKGSISGFISARDGNDRIPFANVWVIPDDNPASVFSTLSGQDGSFRVDNLPPGNFKVVISFLGYKADTLKNILIDKDHPQVQLEGIRLSALSVVLKEVEVTGQTRTATTRLDRITYKTQDFETAKGGDAVDVLNKLPSVSLDQDGVVSVRGASDFMVYLNGKPTFMEPSVLLSQIKATSIESIDIITVPSARYDAQGKGGIINISTKKTGDKGLSISANGLTGGSPWADYTHPLSDYRVNDNRFGAGLNFIYNKEKLSVYGGFNYTDKKVNGTRAGFASLLQENGSYYHMVPTGPRAERTQNYTANAAMDYQLNKKSVVSASYFYGNSTKGRRALYIYDTFYGDMNKNPITDIPVDEYSFYNPNKRMRYGIFHTANIDYAQKFDRNAELKVSALFEHSELRTEIDNRQFQLVEKHYIQTEKTPLNGYRVSVDYTKKLKNGHTLGLGLQPQYFQMNGAFNFDTINVVNNVWSDNTDFENAVDFKRGVYAGYADYSGSWGKLNFSGGMRMEYTVQKMDIDNPDYFTIFDRPTRSRYKELQLDWFPSVHLNYALPGGNKVAFAFSRRINRPPLINMAPFLYREHFEVYVVGDPALEPEFITNYELALNGKIGKSNFNLTGFYRNTDNAIFRVNTVYEKENVLIRSYTNSANTQATGIEFNMDFAMGNFSKIFFSSSVYNFRVKADIFGYKENNRSTNWNVKGNANFNVTESLILAADFNVTSATITAQGRDKMFYMANTSLKYTPKWLQGWDFSLNLLDILKSNNSTVSTRAYNSSGTPMFFQKSEYNLYGPILEISITYSFNMKGKSGKKAASSFGKEQF